ncbi:MAG: MBL fold metallo-hydrolase [Bacteroidales bacterium]|nr:MBL fold metallo-hydrolase [Bacteroidales bacterium]
MLKNFIFNHFGVNCYVVVDDATKECAIVDPGMEASYEDAQLFQYVEHFSLTPKYILLTHAHIDHISGLRQTCQKYNLPVTMHNDGGKLLRQAEAYGSIMGFSTENMGDLETIHADEGTILKLGETEIECRYVPGHCPGSLCYVIPSAKTVITGDALFQGSIGRTDLPGGNYQQLIDKLKERILTLPDDYGVYPGHGESSTIGDEKRYNPFLV